MSYSPPIPKSAKLALGLAALALVAAAVFLALRSPSTPENASNAPRAATATPPRPAPAPQAANLFRSSARDASPVAAAPLPAPTNGPLRDKSARRRISELERDNAELRRRLDEMLNWIVENVQGRYPLPENQMKNLRVAPVDDDLLTSDDLVEVLRLTPDEIDQLDASFLATREILYEIEDSTFTVLPDSGPDRLLLHSPPYAQEGAEVSAVLYDELLGTLGKARFARFMQISGTELARQFDSFGDRDRTLEFQLALDDADNAAVLFIRDETATPDPDDPLIQHIVATERIADALPPEYLPYANRLPELLVPFAESAN